MTESKDLRIMLVDDNNIDIVVNTKLLKIANITSDVVSFSGYKEWSEYLKANQEELENISSVVLMDIQMPEVDGFECIDFITNTYPKITESCNMFMLSSSIDRGDIKRAEENPYIRKVLEKPLDVYQLKGLLGL